jgi:hypothetical protein
MASSKQRTTMNKLNRERKLRERRADKDAKKAARMNADPDAQIQPEEQLEDGTEPAAADLSDRAVETSDLAVQTPSV